MNFQGELSPATKNHVDECDLRLKDPARLRALARTGLMDTPNEIAFDRLAKLAAKILDVPLTIISLIGEDRQFFKAGHGLPAPYDTVREVPIDDSICRYTLAGEEIVAADTSKHSLLRFHPTTGPWGIVAFLTVPIKNAEGHVLGSFCAIDTSVREWKNEDVEIMRELTNSVMTEIQLRIQVSDLANEKTLRERFVAALSHDLRNPIGVGRMAAEILSDDTTDAADRKRFTTMISENMDRADGMIRDLLNVLHVKAGESMQIDVEVCEIESMMKSTVQALSGMNAGRVSLKSEGPVMGYWDASALRRIVDNLVGNAVKYGSKETPITVSLKRDGERKRVKIEVHNFGNPIPAGAAEKLFEAFQRSESAQKSTQKGWGIGLALVRGFAEAHGGNARAISDAEKGTTFIVELPIDARPSKLEH